MLVSIIATVKNEGDAIRPLLDSLVRQTRQPDEIVITDGGSTDHTIAVLQEYGRILPLRIIPVPGSNISVGRNRAIAAATGDIIAATDAGVILDPGWLDAITLPILAGTAQVTAGWFEPDTYTPFETAMGATVLPALDDIDPAAFLPSSRSIAFTKAAWEQVGGYPEWLDYCEDLLFDMALRDQFAPFAFAADAVAYFRPRSSFKAFWKQYYLYARGDGKADLWRKRHAIRYGIYLVALPVLLKGMMRGRPLSWLVMLVAGVVYCAAAFRRLDTATAGWQLAAKLRAFATVPAIRFVGDVAKMVGYPVGIIWRWQQKKRST